MIFLYSNIQKKNKEYIQERNNPQLTYVYNKYAKAKFNCCT